MIAYNNAQADAFTKEVIGKQGFGTLHAWLLNPDPQKHTQLVLDQFSHGKKCAGSVYDDDAVHSICDVGCGTGEMLFQAAEKFSHALLLKGINLFRGQVPPESLTEGFAEIEIGDFESSPKYQYCDGAYDIVMCNYTLGHFKNAVSVISTMRSMLRRGGKLCMYGLCRRSVLWDEIYGYHLYSQRELRSMMFALRDAQVWVPDNAELSPLLDAGVKQEFLRKTLPVFVIGEK